MTILNAEPNTAESSRNEVVGAIVGVLAIIIAVLLLVSAILVTWMLWLVSTTLYIFNRMHILFANEPFPFQFRMNQQKFILTTQGTSQGA